MSGRFSVGQLTEHATILVKPSRALLKMELRLVEWST